MLNCFTHNVLKFHTVSLVVELHLLGSFPLFSIFEPDKKNWTNCIGTTTKNNCTMEQPEDATLIAWVIVGLYFYFLVWIFALF
jgi:hypothetical protein